MGMDVFGRNPDSKAGAYFRANVWSRRPSYELFSVWSIVVATFLGSFLGSGIVMAVNYRRLGRQVAA
jgi:hypothetical protein